jgi:hypothetical protein
VKFFCRLNDGNDLTGAGRSNELHHTSLQGPRQRDPALSKKSADKAVTLSDEDAAKPSIGPESTTGQGEN